MRDSKLIFEYDRDLFAADTIENLADQYAVLLRGAAARPDLALSRLPLMNPATRTSLLPGPSVRDHLVTEPSAGT